MKNETLEVAKSIAALDERWNETGTPMSEDEQTEYIENAGRLAQLVITQDRSVSTFLYEWCVARLEDARESGEVDENVSDAVIEREAYKLEVECMNLASSFVSNEFKEKE